MGSKDRAGYSSSGGQNRLFSNEFVKELLNLFRYWAVADHHSKLNISRNSGGGQIRTRDEGNFPVCAHELGVHCSDLALIRAVEDGVRDD